MSHAPATKPSLAGIETPGLVLDEGRMLNNIARLRTRLTQLGVRLRPHLKTAKSIEVARAVMEGPAGPAAVSTLREAEVFTEAGVRDILYAVGIAPQKLDRVAALRRRGVDLCIVLDCLEQATAVTAAARTTGDRIPVLIEIDCDGHRAGIRASDPLLVEIGRTLRAGGAELRGVMTHAGESYSCRGAAALEAAAEGERAAAVACAETLRSAGLPCPVVSVGSTPTAHFARRLDGVTEVRAGVFVMFDLVMAGIGVCTTDDIALSVLATVTGHRADRGWTFIDAGWMALSRDRGTARQEIDQGYGLVCDVDGRPYPDLIVGETNQEHGIITRRPGSAAPQMTLPIGTQARILPNHACATGAQHDRYHVVTAGSGAVKEWERFRGW
ncbi:DSD1 family PLP-dependent enzyme [Bradyrhizobium jicamae]|uniref:DSD1 family PLP-dependent enzyme n=1 Tax=Bradyrhizobium jicamae TaxID=280332 RepID=A0ABS5FI73_9BRAD|nr:DSD1 family PLP-dependent enzyme [Bradyrhizobium jicamae]MBR0796474.1 DSD1 family PLP-dependent enzyme [Bradyrhizobium jicamae]